VKIGENVHQDFVLKPALKLTGITVDENGKPLAGAEFALQGPK